MSQSTPYHNDGVVGIAKFLLGGTLINSAQLLGTTDGSYALVVFNSENEYELISPEKLLELANNVRRLIAEYPTSRLQQIEADAMGVPTVQSLDEVYAEVDKEAEKYRELFEALVNQSQDENDLPE